MPLWPPPPPSGVLWLPTKPMTRLCESARSLLRLFLADSISPFGHQHLRVPSLRLLLAELNGIVSAPVPGGFPWTAM